MLKMNQKGVSLPVVMLITALIAANSYYFISLNKNAKSTNVSQTTELKEEAEKRRIAAFLADYTVCNANFLGRSITALKNNSTMTSLSKNTVVFLRYGDKYMGQTHTLSKFFFYEDPNPSAPVKTKYSFVATYALSGNSVNVKKVGAVTVPLYVDQDGSGNITRCYARPDEDSSLTGTKVEQAVQNSCLGEVALFANASGDITCKHEAIATNCVTPGGANTGNMLKDVEVTANHELKFNCGYMTSSSCATTTSPFPNLGQYISNTTVQCGSPDPGCGAGSAMIDTGATVSCSSNCPTDQLHHAYQTSSGTPVCYSRPMPCPAGQYATMVKADGTYTCGQIRYKGVSCAANYYVTDFDTQAADPLKCTYYNKAKSCASPNTYTYVNSFNTATPTCVYYNY